MGNCRSSARSMLIACLAGLLALGADLPASLLGAGGSFPLQISILNSEGEVYAVAPGRAYRVAVSCDDPNINQLALYFSGPVKTGLTSSFEAIWNASGFHDLGTSQERRLLVPEDCIASGDLWSFSIVLPNQTAAGIWEARGMAGSSEGVAGFLVSSVYWDFAVVSQGPFTDLVPGGTATGTVRLQVSCNDEFLLNLSCAGLSGPGGVAIAPDKILLDDDPVFTETNETGSYPRSFQKGFLEGPVVEAGIGRETEIHLTLQVPNPIGRGPVQGQVAVEFEPVQQAADLLVDTYVQLLRYIADSLEPPVPLGMQYAADLDTASHKSGMIFPLDIKLKQLEVLEEVGVQIIRVTPAYDIFLHQYEPKISELDSLASQIRADGKKLMIADGGAEEYWAKPMNWSSFSEAFVQRVGNLASRYKPEYYIVVKEPSWYFGMNWASPGGMLTQTTTVEQWVSLTQRLCDEVKRVSPSTRTGVAIALPFQQSLDYLVSADKLQTLDFVGIDVYNILHLGTVDPYLALLTKPKWILETWDGNPDGQQGQMWRRTTSAEWIGAMANYAQSKGFEGMATFFNLWLCYDYSGKPVTFDQVRSALDTRQESFYALQSVVRDSS